MPVSGVRSPAVSSSTVPATVPRWVYVPAAIGAALILLPLAALASRVAWGDVGRLVTSESSAAALALSLRTAAVSTVVCLVLGVPMAIMLARSTLRGRAVVRVPHPQPVPRAAADVVAELGREVPDAHHDLAHALGVQPGELVVDERLAGQRDERLRQRARDLAEPCGLSTGEDEYRC